MSPKYKTFTNAPKKYNQVDLGKEKLVIDL